MKKERLYKLLIIVLVLSNIGMMVFMWVNKPPHPAHKQMENISDVLGLKGTERRAVNVLETAHHVEKRKLLQKDLDLHIRLYSSLDSSALRDSLMDMIQKNKLQLEKMTFDYFAKVASYCNEEQRTKLDNMVQESILRIIGHHPKGKRE